MQSNFKYGLIIQLAWLIEDQFSFTSHALHTLQLRKKQMTSIWLFSHAFILTICCVSLQLIQTISAVDTDEPLVGHKFVFSISATNPNFTIVDKEGKTWHTIPPNTALFFMLWCQLYSESVANTGQRRTYAVHEEMKIKTAWSFIWVILLCIF